MPSQHQAGSDNHDNEAERFLSTDMEIAPIVRGIEDQDRIRNEAKRLTSFGFY